MRPVTRGGKQRTKGGGGLRDSKKKGEAGSGKDGNLYVRDDGQQGQGGEEEGRTKAIIERVIIGKSKGQS